MTAASVEDLPEPVGPVTSTMPFLMSAISLSTGGRFKSVQLGAIGGITRITIACVPRCMKMLTRKRDSPGALNETSAEPCFSNASIARACVPSMILEIAAVWCGKSFSKPGTATGVSLPMSSICGGRPGEKIRSLTLSETESIRFSTAMKFCSAVAVGVCGALECGVLIR